MNAYLDMIDLFLDSGGDAQFITGEGAGEIETELEIAIHATYIIVYIVEDQIRLLISCRLISSVIFYRCVGFTIKPIWPSDMLIILPFFLV